MKYELTETTKIVNNITLYQIQALKDFDNIKSGDLGGWIQSKSNLSQTGDCWVYGNARVSDNAMVSGNARVWDDVWVYGNAKVYGDAWVYGNARVSDNAMVSGNARVYGDTQVSGNAKVYGDTQVSGNAKVYGDAKVYGNAVVAQEQYIKYNHVISDITDIKSNLLENIEAQTGLVAINSGEIYCYKHVRANLSSLHDPSFKYTVGEYVAVEDIDPDQTVSCGNGLHVSNAQYWNGNGGQTRLFCRVHVDDIVAVQQGKIRCRKLFVIDVCGGQVF